MGGKWAFLLNLWLFADTAKIDSLWDFTALVKLYLNNNLIEKIEGLEYLSNLKWLGMAFTFCLLTSFCHMNNNIPCVCLDLSSNKIKKIEGLDNLRALEMLLLAKNRISVIENIDTLEKLTLFNISHNCIENRDNVMIYFFQKS